MCTWLGFRGRGARTTADDLSFADALSQPRPQLLPPPQGQEQHHPQSLQLEQLEDRLLERIANAPTDILSDTKLIEGLEATKETVLEVKDAVARATLAGQSRTV